MMNNDEILDLIFDGLKKGMVTVRFGMAAEQFMVKRFPRLRGELTTDANIAMSVAEFRNPAGQPVAYLSFKEPI